MPVRFSRWSFDRALRADLLGEHNEDILREVADLSDQEIAALYQQRVLVRDPSLEAKKEEPAPIKNKSSPLE
jgi:CoA:oxalate CoA-transferase